MKYCQKNPLKIPHVRPGCFFFFNVKELSWLRIKSVLLMTHLLVIGFSKQFAGKAYLEINRSGLWAPGLID